MRVKKMGEVLRALGYWFDALENGGERSHAPLHNRMVELIAVVVHREDVTPEEATELLRNGYLFHEIEKQIDEGSRPRPRR